MRAFTILRPGTKSVWCQWRLAGLVALFSLVASAAQAQFVVTGTTPAPNAVSAPLTAPISVRFSQPVNPGPVNLELKGTRDACYEINVTHSASSVPNVVNVTPTRPLHAGEHLSLTVPASVRSTGGTPATPYVMQFRAATGGSSSQRLAVKFQPDQRLTKLSDATLADVDNDGDLDALAADPTAGQITVMLNDGTGHMIPDASRGFAVALNTTVVRCADMDNDGDIDVLSCSPTLRAVRMCLNDGTGHFGTATAIGVASSWMGPSDLCVGDMDGDGDLDITVADAVANTVTTCRNLGSSGFPPTAFVSIACAGKPVSLSCDDMDNDGALDVVASCLDTGEIAILLWKLSQWTAGTRIALPTGSNPIGVVTGDLDGDGTVDMAVHSAGSTGGSTGSPVPSGLAVLLRCPPPNQNHYCLYPASGPGRPIPVRPAPAERLATGDMDGDGDLDLLLPDALGTSVVVYRNNGTGSFTDGDANPYRSGGDKVYCWGQGMTGVCTGDLDGDGDLDAIAVCSGSGDVATAKNQVPVRVTALTPAPVVPGSRLSHDMTLTCDAPVSATNVPALDIRCTYRGTYQQAATAAQSSTSANSFHWTWLGSRAAPFYTTTRGGTTADGRAIPPTQWLLSKRFDPSDGIFVPIGTNLSIVAGEVLASADLDGDGYQDIVSARNNGSKWDLKANKRTASNSWAAPIVSADPTIPTGYTPAFVRCADFTGDGHPDLVVVGTNATASSSLCVFYQNNGTGQFTQLNSSILDGIVTDLALGDLENDGEAEAVMPIPGSHSCARRGINERGLKLYDMPDAVQYVAFAPGDMKSEGTLVCVVGGTSPSIRFVPVDAAGDLHPTDAPSTALPAAPGGSVEFRDLDSDNDLIPDAIVSMPSYHAVKTKGTGANVGRTVPTGTGSGPTHTRTGDVDGDGDIDLVVVCPGNSTLWIGLNNGSGVFSTSRTVAVGAVPVDAWVGDVDSNGMGDVLVQCADNTVRTFSVGPPSPLDLVITTVQTVPAGNYNHISVLEGGDATFAVGSTCALQCTAGYQGIIRGPLTFGPAADLVVSPGATVYVSDPAGLSATGSSGPFRYSSPPTTGTMRFSPKASYVYNGTTPQVTGTGLPPVVWELTSSNPAGLSLSQSALITGKVCVSDLSLMISQPTAHVGMRSTPDSTAIAVNEGTGVIQGPVTVQRSLNGPTYFPHRILPGQARYVHLAPPISGGTVADFGTSAFTPTCSAAFNTSPTPASVQPFPTVQYYDQSRLATAVNNLSTFDKGWMAPVALTDALIPGRGYTVNMPIDRTLSYTGTLNNGDMTLALSRTSGTTAADGGWAFVGNPYPAPIDWSLVTAADRVNLDAAMYVFEGETQYTGRYLTYANGIGTASPALVMGQGFWTRVSSGHTSGTLTFSNRIRRIKAELYVEDIRFHRGSGGDRRPQLRLDLRGNGQTDAAFVYVEAGATSGLDAEYDAAKLPNSTGLNLSAVASTGEALSIQGLAALGNGATVVPLTLGLPAAGSYSLAVGELLNFALNTQLVLRDNLRNTSTLLTATTRYDFTSTATTVSGRFFLELSATGALASASQLLAAGVSIYPNPAHGTVAVQVPAVAGASTATLMLTDALGRTVRTASLALPATGQRYELTGLAPGMYAVRIHAGTASAVQRLVVE